MAKASPIRQRMVPQHGRIEGGPLNGWAYGLLDVTARGSAIYIGVMATPPDPAWPFPRAEVDLHGRRDFTKLANPGGIAREYDAETLITAALEAVKT